MSDKFESASIFMIFNALCYEHHVIIKSVPYMCFIGLFAALGNPSSKVCQIIGHSAPVEKEILTLTQTFELDLAQRSSHKPKWTDSRHQMYYLP